MVLPLNCDQNFIIGGRTKGRSGELGAFEKWLYCNSLKVQYQVCICLVKVFFDANINPSSGGFLGALLLHKTRQC